MSAVASIREERDRLKKVAEFAYRYGLWESYERATNKYMFLEDNTCECPKDLNIKVKSCPFHGDQI